MLANNETIGWHPEHVKHGRFGKWLENNVDWALSRDRYWGTPLPVWRCADARLRRARVHRLGRRAARALRRRGPRRPAPPLHRRGRRSTASKCGGEMRRVESVIDTWYDSGAMPFAQFHYPFENEAEFEERFPADYICEAQDQTRGWFYTLLAESTLLFGESSYRNCVCLGLILDPEGQKMSKSRGNVVDPWEVISAHGADAFRWYYLTAQQPWAGYRFSVDTVGESVRQFLLTLWNTYSFWVLYANAEDLGPPTSSGAPEPADDLDRWALSRLQATTATVRERMDEFDCTAAGRAIAEYVEELSNWYVRLSRRRFWDGDRAAFATLRHCLLETAALLAPFIPFLADEIHLNLAGGALGQTGERPTRSTCATTRRVDPALADPELETAMEAVRLTVELGRAARAQAKAKVRQPLRRAVIVANEAEREAIEARADLVTAELNVKELDFVSDEGELVSYTAKPNYRTLGPRFGKRMPQVAAAVEALDAAHVAAVMADGGEVGINVEGDEHTLGPDEVTLALQPLDGYEVEAEAGHAVALAARARRRAAPRGPRPRDRPRRPDRPQRGRPGDHRPDRPRPRRRRGAARGRPRPRGLPGRRGPRHLGRLRGGDGAGAKIDGRELTIAREPGLSRSRCRRCSRSRRPRPRWRPPLTASDRRPNRSDTAEHQPRSRSCCSSTAAPSSSTTRTSSRRPRAGDRRRLRAALRHLPARRHRPPRCCRRGRSAAAARPLGLGTSTPTAPRPAAPWRRCSPATGWSPPPSPRRRSPTSIGCGRRRDPGHRRGLAGHRPAPDIESEQPRRCWHPWPCCWSSSCPRQAPRPRSMAPRPSTRRRSCC